MPLKKEFSDLRQSFEPPHRVISLCSGIRSLWGHSGIADTAGLAGDPIPSRMTQRRPYRPAGREIIVG
jgi:hypothetical protein